MTDNIETWPKKIYLITDDEFDHVPEYEAVQGINEDGICWCSHPHTNNDVEYVRADIAAVKAKQEVSGNNNINFLLDCQKNCCTVLPVYIYDDLEKSDQKLLKIKYCVIDFIAESDNENSFYLDVIGNEQCLIFDTPEEAFDAFKNGKHRAERSS